MTKPHARSARASRFISSLSALSRRGLTSMMGTWPGPLLASWISFASQAASTRSQRLVTRAGSPPDCHGRRPRSGGRSRARRNRPCQDGACSHASWPGKPLAFLLAPWSHAFGRSSSISSRLTPSDWRSRRPGTFSTSSPLQGRLRAGRGLRHRCLPHLDRRRVPREPPRASFTSASCMRSARRGSENAREKVASLGTAPARGQSHGLRSVASTFTLSIRSRVVGRSQTDLAMNARQRPTVLQTVWHAATRRLWFSSSGPTSAASAGKGSP